MTVTDDVDTWFEAARGATGRIGPFSSCTVCGALVEDANRETHLDWHYDLRNHLEVPSSVTP